MPHISRRAFLKALGAGAALSAGGIALIEAEPIVRTYFLPPRGGWARFSGYDFLDVSRGDWLTLWGEISAEFMTMGTAAVEIRRDGKPVIVRANELLAEGFRPGLGIDREWFTMRGRA